MERIKQAVEQARTQRKELGTVDVPAAPNNSGVTPASADAAGQRPKSDSIDYTQIRTVEVSRDVREKNRLVAGIDGNPLQDTYRMLRTQVLQEMRANKWNTIAITSPATGSGKTLTAINLAITIGRDLSHTALLVDGDLRQPSVAGYFGYTPQYGLNDHLFNDVSLSEILFHPDMDGLTVLPGRESVGESAELLGSERIVTLLNDIRGRYSDRIILLDIAPILTVDDALALAPNIDCMLMVAESGETKREDLGRALELMEGVPIVGTVLNKVRKKVAKPY